MRTAYLLLALSLLLPACKYLDTGLQGDPAQKAMGYYAEGYNQMVAEIDRSIVDRYTSAIPAEGPKEFERIHLFPATILLKQRTDKARSAFASAKSAAPSSMAHLGPLSDEVLAAATQITEVYEEALKYYDAKDWEDDAGAKARQIHTRMQQGIARWRQSRHVFSVALDEIEDKQMAAEVAKHAADKDYGYWLRRFNLDAKKLLRAGTAEPKAFDIAFAEMQAAYDGLHAFVKAEGSDFKAPFKAYSGHTDRFHAAAKRLRRARRAEPADPKRLEREHKALIQAYNTLIAIGNSMFELEAHGLL